jgi:hypothetical protein
VMKGIPTGAHAEVRDRRALAECLLALRLFSVLTYTARERQPAIRTLL